MLSSGTGQKEQQKGQQRQQERSTVHRRPPKVFEAWGSHEYTFFILHGRGDSADNFAPSLLLASTRNGGSFQNVLRNTKLIFLGAGLSSRWMPGGGEWFRMSSLTDPNINSHEQIQGLSEHATILQDMIEAEVQSGIPAERIVLIGLSQGCAQSLFSLLTLSLKHDGSGRRLGAVVGMSGWLPFSDIINAAVDEATNSTVDGAAPETNADRPAAAASNEQGLQAMRRLCEMAGRHAYPESEAVLATPVFLGHGMADQRVHPRLGETARDALQRLGFDVQWFMYDVGHWWKAPEEIDDIIAFLAQKIGLEFSNDQPPASYHW